MIDGGPSMGRRGAATRDERPARARPRPDDDRAVAARREAAGAERSEARRRFLLGWRGRAVGSGDGEPRKGGRGRASGVRGRDGLDDHVARGPQSGLHLREHAPNLRHVTVLLDGDEPGRKAADTVAARLAQNWWCRIVHLADGEEPDTVDPALLERRLGRGVQR
jgi:hypothetical protein